MVLIFKIYLSFEINKSKNNSTKKYLFMCEEDNCINIVLYYLVTFLGFSEDFLAGGDQEEAAHMISIGWDS